MKLAGRFMLMVSVILMLGVAGCGGAKTGGGSGGGSGGARKGKVSEEDKAKIEEARQAAEDSEKKLSELRQERIRLESQDAGGE
jgi:hypothetical protein